jgi:hypothetical protein
MSRSFFIGVCVCLVFLGPCLAQEDQIEKAKIFQEEYALVTESDMYCSVFVLDGPLPGLKIIGAERQDEKILMSEADTFYINKGKADGLEIGQLFLVVTVGPKIGNFGLLSSRTGRARIIKLEEHKGAVTVDKTCGQMSLGDYLVPFEEKEGRQGRDEGYAFDLDESQGIKGSVIFIETDFHVAGTGQWAIIDLGKDQGIQLGQQLTIFKRARKDLPREAIGNLVVVDVQSKTSTVKILSCRDSVEPGFQVQTH